MSEEVAKQKVDNAVRNRVVAYAYGKIKGFPALRVGDTIDVQHVGGRFSSAEGMYWYITRVENIISENAYYTEFMCESILAGNRQATNELEENEECDTRSSSVQSDEQAKSEDDMPITPFSGEWDDFSGECPTYSEKGSAEYYHVALNGLADLGTRVDDVNTLEKAAKLIMDGLPMDV